MIRSFFEPVPLIDLDKRLAVGAYYIPWSHDKNERYFKTYSSLLNYIFRHPDSPYAPFTVYMVSRIVFLKGTRIVRKIYYEEVVSLNFGRVLSVPHRPFWEVSNGS